MRNTRTVTMIVLLGLGIVLASRLAKTTPKTPIPVPPPPPPQPPQSGTWVAYVPTPQAAIKRAHELSLTMKLGEKTYESDPSGKYNVIMYACNTHPANPTIPHPHRGVNVWRPK